MSLLDNNEDLNNNYFNEFDNTNLLNLEEIDMIYESWQKTEDSVLKLRSRKAVRDKMINSMNKLTSDIQRIDKCNREIAKYSKRSNCKNSYFIGLKIFTIVSANLVAYYYFFC